MKVIWSVNIIDSVIPNILLQEIFLVPSMTRPDTRNVGGVPNKKVLVVVVVVVVTD